LTCQNNQFIDNSTANSSAGFESSVLSVPRVQPFSPFAPNTAFSVATVGGSYYGDGSGDYLSIPYQPNLLLNGVDSTIECWVYLNTAVSNWASGGTPGVQAIVGQGTGAVGGVYSLNYYLGVDSTSLNFLGPGATAITTPASNLKPGQWNHIAVTVTSGSSAALYINGVSYASGSITSIGSNSGYQTNLFGNFLTGGGGGNNSYINGYATGLRIVKGQKLTSGNFTPPTSPVTASTVGWTGANVASSITGSVVLMSNFDKASIIDYTGKHNFETIGDTKANTSVYKFNSSSISVDGNEYLLSPFNPLEQLSTGDFTVEFWINAGASGTYNQVIGTLVSAADTGCWRIGNRHNSGNSVYFARGNGTGFDEAVYSVNVNDGSWHHVACVRISGVIYMYVDGTARTLSSGSASISGTCSSSNALYIGYNGRDTSYLLGNLSDLRITRSARYTTNFTPPTRSFPTR
jgi:hypothetical protein